jgi:hypothetical protein
MFARTFSVLPVQLTLNFVEITSFSSAESATIGLMVDPGGYKPCIDLLIKGFFGLLSISFQLPWIYSHKKINLDRKMGKKWICN